VELVILGVVVEKPQSHLVFDIKLIEPKKLNSVGLL